MSHYAVRDKVSLGTKLEIIDFLRRNNQMILFKSLIGNHPTEVIEAKSHDGNYIYSYFGAYHLNKVILIDETTFHEIVGFRDGQIILGKRRFGN